MPKLKNYTGEVFGIFKVIKDLGLHYPTKKSSKKQRYMIAECIKCGISREFMLPSLRNKLTKCECQYKPLVTKEWLRCYKIHHGMTLRCYNKKNKDYSRYGGKGIFICKEWINNPKDFYEWAIKNGYHNNLSIDRIDNNKGYSPENCRWATKEEQQQNKSCSTPIEKIRQVKELLKQDITMAEVARLVNIEYTIVKRINHKRSWNNVN